MQKIQVCVYMLLWKVSTEYLLIFFVLLWNLQQKESAGTTGSESDAGDVGDGEFEPTAEMLVDDYDDERTLDEEEDMEEGPDREEEIDNLEKVGWWLWYYLHVGPTHCCC